MIEYDEVNKLLSLEFSSFKIDSDEWNLPYIVANNFEVLLLRAYQLNDIESYQKGLLFIERLHVEGSDKVKELATVGYLEALLDWPERQQLYNDLGLESQKWWNELILFWNKEIKYIGESFNATV